MVPKECANDGSSAFAVNMTLFRAGCSAGEFSTGGLDAICQKCPEDTFASGSGNGQCTPCPVQTTTNGATGASECGESQLVHASCLQVRFRHNHIDCDRLAYAQTSLGASIIYLYFINAASGAYHTRQTAHAHLRVLISHCFAVPPSPLPSPSVSPSPPGTKICFSLRHGPRCFMRTASHHPGALNACMP
jgi:hypothetical protein